MPGKVQEPQVPAVVIDLPDSVGTIFNQAQTSSANHKKNHVALHKIHMEASDYFLKTKKGYKLTGERRFQDAFLLALTRSLSLRKGDVCADRIAKFIGGYMRHLNEKVEEEEIDDPEEDEATRASRFTSRIVRFLIQGFVAKDKNVRYRVFKILDEMIAHLGTVEPDIYLTLRTGLLERMLDKEANIRSLAICCLPKLCRDEVADELVDGEISVVEALVEAMTYDSATDVRKAALLNLPLTLETIPYVLQRTRDQEATIRKAVYANSLKSAIMISSEEGEVPGPTHPSNLKINHLILILKNGLEDRDTTVRDAAITLITEWINAFDPAVVKGEPEVKDEPTETPAQGLKTSLNIESGLISLIEEFDVANRSDALEHIVAMIKSVFKTRPDILDNIEFGERYWRSVGVPNALLARVFVEYCKETKNDTQLSAAQHTMTSMALNVESHYTSLTLFYDKLAEEQFFGGDDKDQKPRAAERKDREFILSELLKLASYIDYAKQYGQREMLTHEMLPLIRPMLSENRLPENLLEPCLDVLRELAANERDLIRMVVEIVQEMRDGGEEAEPSQTQEPAGSSSSPPGTVKPRKIGIFLRPRDEMDEKVRQRLDDIDLKCLTLCIGMLRRVNGTLQQNSTLSAILQEFVGPAIQRTEPAFLEKGLTCLSLCALLAEDLAAKTLGQFLAQLSKSNDDIKFVMIQAIFDLLIMHQGGLFRGNMHLTFSGVVEYLIAEIGEQTNPRVLALLCQGIAKLVFLNFVKDPTAIRNLFNAYLSPLTADNQELRQSLLYFFGAFSYSSATNQRTMQEIFTAVFNDAANERKNLGEDEYMLSSEELVKLFLEWTDPSEDPMNGKRKLDPSLHLELADQILRELFERGYVFEKEDKKILFQVLPRLYLPEKVDDAKIGNIKLLIDKLRQCHPPRDTPSNTALTKFEASIAKKYEKQLEGFSEEEYRKFDHLTKLFEFLDDIIPDEDDSLIDAVEPKTRGRKRRSQSIATTSTETERAESVPPFRERETARKRSKRPRLSGSDHEAHFGNDSTPQDNSGPEMAPPPVPQRRRPQRAAAPQKPLVEVIVISSDSDDEPPTPAPARRAGRPRASRPPLVKEEEQEEDIDADISSLLRTNASSNRTWDSIMDSDIDSEEEEEVLNGLLEDD